MSLQYIVEQSDEDSASDRSKHRWCEVSGAIEHWMKKFGGYPIPNGYAYALLPNPKSIVSMNPDLQHYDREIGLDKDVLTKCIYGIKNEALYQKFINEFSTEYFPDYPERKSQEDDDINESREEYNEALRKWAAAVIETVYEYYQSGLYELPQPIYDILVKARDTLLQLGIKDSHFNDAEFLLDAAPLLEFHEFKI